MREDGGGVMESVSHMIALRSSMIASPRYLATVRHVIFPFQRPGLSLSLHSIRQHSLFALLSLHRLKWRLRSLPEPGRIRPVTWRLL